MAEEPGADSPDARGQLNITTNCNVARMPVARDAMYYNMNFKRRGLAIILNHEYFMMPSLKRRTGTNVDCQNLEKVLAKLGFEVKVHKDLTVSQIYDVVAKAVSANHSDCDCFLMAVLTHGEMSILYGQDSAYKSEALWQPFTADKCPTLAGKPKLFFIQACQGDRLDKGITLRTEVDGDPMNYKIPIHADFLIAYSTIPESIFTEPSQSSDTQQEEVLEDIPDVFGCNFSNMDPNYKPESSAISEDGFYSWRNTTNGSWFMQALCMELDARGSCDDLLRLLTFVIQRVAINFESNTPGDMTMHQRKQIPCVMTMLTRLLLFTPKSIK